jgi:hypothetical protein
MPSTAIYYRVRAHNAYGDSSYSEVVTATTSAANVAPTAPTNVSATAQSSSVINVTWAQSSGSESGFRIYWSTNAGATYFSDTVAANSTSYAHINLTPSTTYSYRVSAYNSYGESTLVPTTFGPVAATTLADNSPPIAPTNVVATASTATQVIITWTTSAGADHYQIERRSNQASAFEPVGTIMTTFYPDGGLSPDHTYVYRVRAVNSAGLVSDPSDVDVATTVIFEDDPLAGSVTTIRAQHLIQLRTAVNALRTYAGLPVASWTDPTLSNQILIKAQHIRELRDKLAEALAVIGLSAPAYTDPTLNQGVTVIKTDHVQQIRQRVK